MEGHRLAWGAAGLSAALHAALLFWGPVWDTSEPSGPPREIDLLPPTPLADDAARAVGPAPTESSEARTPAFRSWVDDVALRHRGHVTAIADLSTLRVDEESWDGLVQGISEAGIEPIELPVLLRGPDPPYPRRSRELGEEGTVVLAILVGEDGRVRDCVVHRSSGYPLLDGSALSTARDRWRFRPSWESGKPVARWVRVPVEFRITTAWPGR